MRSLLSAVLFAASIPLISTAPALAGERNVTIVAHNFAFVPATVKLERGESYTIHLKSTDGAHGLNVPQVGIHNVIITAHEQTMTITPKTAGTFVAHCTQYCGTGHATMAMTFVVSAPSSTPKTSDRDAHEKPSKASNPCAAPPS